VKDSTWVRERQALEKNKGRDINEVLLMDDEEQLYEGMASNFLAVSNSTVYCASLDHILLGTILKMVVDICKQNDIPFEWQFPRLEDAREGKWDGCFITSTSRLLLPIESIYVGHEM
jgi:branched-subunit amino acid aminotransferase/4-amino-4-deoxychorismate lyase